MSKTQFWTGVALLYTVGLAAAFIIAHWRQAMPTDAKGALALLPIPLIWAVGPIILTLVWLAMKRDLAAARFGLLIFAALYLVITGLHLWWRELL
jgi:hypothetical protein